MNSTWIALAQGIRRSDRFCDSSSLLLDFFSQALSTSTGFRKLASLAEKTSLVDLPVPSTNDSDLREWVAGSFAPSIAVPRRTLVAVLAIAAALDFVLLRRAAIAWDLRKTSLTPTRIVITH